MRSMMQADPVRAATGSRSEMTLPRAEGQEAVGRFTEYSGCGSMLEEGVVHRPSGRQAEDGRVSMRLGRNSYVVAVLGLLGLYGQAARAADLLVANSAAPSRTPGAFRTIGACVAAARSGDRCLVAAGRYRETVTGRSGISVEAAPGGPAIIDGTDPLEGWVPLGGGLWSIAYTRSASIPTIQIFIDGVPGNQARWPNASADPVHTNWAVMQAGTTAGLVIDSKLPSGDWRGATVHIFSGTNPYSHKTATVIASAPGRLAINDPDESDCPIYCAASGGFYYVFGVKAAADTPGEWYLQGGRLYLLLPRGYDPNGGHIAAKSRLLGIDMTQASNITVRGLNLFATAIATGDASRNDVIDGITAEYVSELDILDTPGNPEPIGASVTDSGFVLRGSGNVLRNSTITHSAGNGVTIDGSNITVENNLFQDIGYLGSYVAPVEIISGGGAQVLHNTIAEAAGYGITGGLGPATLASAHIAYNNVHDTMLQHVDGGPIYFCCAGINTAGMSIDHNWVHGYAAPRAPFYGDGIYLDNGLGTGVVITENLVARPANAEAGIALNGLAGSSTGRGNIVRFNTITGSTPGDIWFDDQIALTLTGNRIGNGFSDLGGNSYVQGSPADNRATAAGAGDLSPDPNRAGVGCNFAGCSSPRP